MLQVGQTPKDFILKDSFGALHQLSSYRGKKVVIYFYPKDGTSDCTLQACTFRDFDHAFKEKGIIVIGISRDKVSSHKKFVLNHQLPFTLLSDEGLVVAEQFGVKVEKSMYGKKYFTNTRTTFVLNEEGIITHVFEKASPSENASDIIKALS
ncbi:MAG: peroxiredoxin [Bacillota bacterium]|nr:MAG: peroxiredoxin [Bacillota bacterium]